MNKKCQPAGIGMVPSKTELGSFIRACRLKLGMRQFTLAKMAGLAQNQISSIEIGTRKYLEDGQLKRLAKALQCETEELSKLMPIKPQAWVLTELGRFIHSRREELGMSFEVFAKKMNMTLQQVKRLEARTSPSLRYDLLKLLANALDLDLSVFSKFGPTQKVTKSKLGQLVRSRRRELGLSMETLGEKLGVSRQFVNQIEFGRTPLGRNSNFIVRLAKALKLNIDGLEALRPKRRLKATSTTSPLGRFLATKRLELHFTQGELAERADVALENISRYETGRLYPSTGTLSKIAKALNCKIPPELITPPHTH